MRRSLVLFSSLLLALGACSLFTSLDGLQGSASGDGGGGDGDVSGDGGTTKNDGGGSGDGSTNGDSGPTNLIANGGFEEGAAGCGGTWSGGYGATYALVGDARTGSKACMMCPIASGEPSYALQTTNPLTLGPGSYHSEAWIRAPLDAGAASSAGVLFDDEFPDGGNTFYQGTQVTPDVVWVNSIEDFTLSDAKSQVTFQVHVFVPNDGCILIDDIVLYGP